MGGRFSVPRAPDGISEDAKAPRGRGINVGRKVITPLAAVTLVGIFFVYSRTSVQAAKLNAQKHREADGGQISWRNESLRRHGQLDKIEDDRSNFKQALLSELERKKTKPQEGVQGKADRHSEEEKLRKMLGKDE